MTRPVETKNEKKEDKKDKLHLGMRLNAQDHKLLKKMAEEDDRTMSNLIVVLIRKEARHRGLM